MVTIYFVSPYLPIMCGIADYTSYLVRSCPTGDWGVLSFDLEKYDSLFTHDDDIDTDRVWYGIPGREGFSASAIREGLRELGARNEESVLW